MIFIFPLLSSTQEAKANFVKWLQTHADRNGHVILSKSSLRMASYSELQSGPLLPDGSLALFIDSPETQSSELFSINTYSKNLKTNLLGRTVLYAEVVSSTMDLFEG